jgi:hypothetical protein
MKIKKIEKGKQIDYINYIDTDSNFFSIVPLVKHRFPDLDITDNNKMVELILPLATEIQGFVNSMFDTYTKKFFYVDTHRIKFKQEIIAQTGLWIAKKRYALLVINKKGVPIYDKETNELGEIEVKGIDVVRSNFPTEFRSFTKQLLKDILKKANKKYIDTQIFALKDKLKDFTAINIMFPSGIKNMDDYQNSESFNYLKGTPAHVRAALSYNDLLVYLGYDKHISPIQNNDKIKWTYLRQNKYGLESIALKGDNEDPPEIVDLVTVYMDRFKNFDSVLKNKLNDFYSALGWGVLGDSELIDEFFG